MSRPQADCQPSQSASSGSANSPRSGESSTETVSITPVNQPPTLTNVAETALFTEGTPVTLSGAVGSPGVYETEAAFGALAQAPLLPFCSARCRH